MFALGCARFEGRIGTTRFLVDKKDCTQLKVVKDHYVIVSYSRNVYVDHVASHTARLYGLAEELISVV